MPSSSALLTLATAISAVNAAYQGFNYGSTFTNGQPKAQTDFEAEFKTAAGLDGTDGAFTSARLYTMIQGGTPNSPISAIPAAINTKTSLLFGLWASGGDAAFANEIAALKATISQYCGKLDGLVAGISIGSEDLYRITPTGVASNAGPGAQPGTLVNYINQVRDTIKGSCLSDVPIGHVDTWNAWVLDSNKPVVDAVDWLGMDTYPYYENTNANSISNAKSLYEAALQKIQNAGPGKEVWVTETGWPVNGVSSGAAIASTANARSYWEQVGCPNFGKTNVWWYTLQDAAPDAPNPSFGLIGSTLTETPLFDLSCKNVDTNPGNPASSSAASSKPATSSAAASSTKVTTPATTPTSESSSSSSSSSSSISNPGSSILAPTAVDAVDAEPVKLPFKPVDPADKSSHPTDLVDWKQQYRLRHNWARGLCEVRQVQVNPNFSLTPILERRTLVKVVNGLAVTVDLQAGLRAWDLRTQLSIAQTTTETHDGIHLVPTALALDGQKLEAGTLDIMLGFNDGTFGIWRLTVNEGRLAVLYRQDKSYVGRLTSVAYSYPYALTAAELGFITLYTFETPAPEPEQTSTASPSHRDGDIGYLSDGELSTLQVGSQVDKSADLSNPFVLSSLKSDYSRQPLVLSLRQLKNSAVASIAYSFDTVGGWAIGIQNFDIRPSGSSKPDVITSRVAYTLPTETGALVTTSSYRPKCPTCSNFPDLYMDDDEGGPTKLCYSHPYLLATMHDNTLVLFVVTATEKSLVISNATRLYGHTSGIADADVTPEGRAVSVSQRGDEIRVWDLEGRQSDVSVEVRPREGRDYSDADDEDDSSDEVEHRRNWVGTDDHRVTVLRETSDGAESLVTYDFT